MYKTKEFKNLLQLTEAFKTEKDCEEHLKAIRWENGSYCPHCGCTKIYEFKDKRTYKCSACRKKLSIKVGTIFEDSKISLRKWFIAIYLITSHKKGISSCQLAKDIGVTQKTAWFMLHRLRKASETKAFNRPLKGTVEVDETYIGGKEKNKHKDKRTKGTQGRNTLTKTPVLGMLERKGNVKAMKVKDVTHKTIGNILTNNIVFGSNLFTDEYRSYRGLEWLFKHDYVKHGQGNYVNGNVHTNSIEGFWSILKRGINGIYHWTSSKHLNSYLNEFTFRYNTTNISEEGRFNFLLANSNGRLKYKNLINA